MRKLVLLIAGLALVAATSCGGTSEDTAANFADELFVNDMIPHHEEAMEMSALARSQASDSRVKEMAAAIEAAQGPEITKMEQWVRAWNITTVPAVGGGGGHDHHEMSGSGAVDMEALKVMTGRDFDRAFLSSMITHHQGAVVSAEKVLENGNSPEVRALATSVRDSQNDEIKSMQELLTQL